MFIFSRSGGCGWPLPQLYLQAKPCFCCSLCLLGFYWSSPGVGVGNQGRNESVFSCECNQLQWDATECSNTIRVSAQWSDSHGKLFLQQLFWMSKVISLWFSLALTKCFVLGKMRRLGKSCIFFFLFFPSPFWSFLEYLQFLEVSYQKERMTWAHSACRDLWRDWSLRCHPYGSDHQNHNVAHRE